MSFDVAAEAYDRFMGRYSLLLSPQLADLAGVRDGQRVLDVGCGPGALTAELVTRLGAAAVAAVDPSQPFVAAARARNPGVEVLRASAEQLPFAERSFDAALAQLVEEPAGPTPRVIGSHHASKVACSRPTERAVSSTPHHPRPHPTTLRRGRDRGLRAGQRRLARRLAARRPRSHVGRDLGEPGTESRSVAWIRGRRVRVTIRLGLVLKVAMMRSQ